jgi:hypothetical protein
VNFPKQSLAGAVAEAGAGSSISMTSSDVGSDLPLPRRGALKRQIQRRGRRWRLFFMQFIRLVSWGSGVTKTCRSFGVVFIRRTRPTIFHSLCCISTDRTYRKTTPWHPHQTAWHQAVEDTENIDKLFLAYLRSL